MRLTRRLGVLLGVLSLGVIGRAEAEGTTDAPAPASREAPPTSPETPQGSPARPVNHLSEVFYLTSDVGVQYVGLEQLHLTKELLPSSVERAGTGPAVGAAAGVRIFFLTLGPHFRYGSFRDWDFWTLDGELGFRVPLGALEPSMVLGAGYAKLGRLENRSVRVQGYNVRLALGLDYYLSHLLSVGGAVTGEVMGMTRPGVDLNASAGGAAADVYRLDGSSVGFAVMASLSAGLHL